MLVAAVLGAVGVWLVWRAFHPPSFGRSLGVAPLLGGLFALSLAVRALLDWVATRRR